MPEAVREESKVKERMEPQLTKNALKVLHRRYLRKDEEGNVVETPAEMFWRVAVNVASAERKFDPDADVEAVAETFYEMMAKLEFVPNSPTLMNAGRQLQQLSACFVLPVDDSIESIFEVIKNTALIHKSGGGTGFSFSRIRPRNDIVSTSHGLSSGPISFMRVFNEATEAINQGGFRRGANMAVLRVDHPDIKDFITAKKDNDQLNNFNISVGITPEFLQALERDEEYDLVNPRTGKPCGRLNAREVFDLIVDMAWRNGEPGIVFLHRLNEGNPTPALGEIESTNPCGEQPLLPYESCNLGSINLSRMVTEDGKIDFDKLREIVRTAVRFLDDVVEVNRYPLPSIAEMTRKTRKVGLGVMGFADMLIKMDIPYNSDRALETAEQVMKFIREEAHEASRALAEERGPFPAFPQSVYAERGEKPMRNATVTTIAPTGTISIIAGCSSGIEPLYAVVFSRNVMDGTMLTECHPVFAERLKEAGLYSDELLKKIVENNGSIQKLAEIPGEMKRIFVVAHDIDVEWHVKMQAAFQKYTDNAVSKTVNLRREATREDVFKAFMLAYRLGCKGVTVYRDGSREGQVLSVPADKDKKEGHKADQGGTTEMHLKPRKRPDVLKGKTYKMPTGCGNLYVTINQDEKGRAFELFAEIGKAGGCAASQCQGIGRLISLALRCGIEPEEVAKQLIGISCHSPTGFGAAKITSCSDAIAKALKKHIESSPNNGGTGDLVHNHVGGACPDCGGRLEYEGGCVVCRLCGYSKCG